MDLVHVLDHGYVRLVDVLGDDLLVVNAARVSFDKESSWQEAGGGDAGAERSLRARDQRLLDFLVREGHTSPFRHPTLSFEVYAPLMVMRQWGKYRIGSVWAFQDSDDPRETWNESSRRYVTEEPVCYCPEEWREAPANKKQGSGAVLPASPVLHDLLRRTIEEGQARYAEAMAAGVCAEQARLFLPAYALYLRARWTVSLQGVIHFLRERQEDGAQYEIRAYALAVRQLAAPHFPASFAAWELG